MARKRGADFTRMNGCCVDRAGIRCYLIAMSISLTSYWQMFVDQLIASGRYNNQSEVIRAGLRALEEREIAREAQAFKRVFNDGLMGEPDKKVIESTIERQKAFRKKRE